MVVEIRAWVQGLVVVRGKVEVVVWWEEAGLTAVSTCLWLVGNGRMVVIVVIINPKP